MTTRRALVAGLSVENENDWQLLVNVLNRAAAPRSPTAVLRRIIPPCALGIRFYGGKMK